MRPGQYVHLLDPSPAGLLLPAEPVAGFDRVAGHIELYVDGRGGSPGRRELLALREGDRARLAGPLGRGFEIDARSRYLLVVTDGWGAARVRAVVIEAVATGRRVTVLAGAPGAGEVFPSALLPEEAEYVVATEDGSLGHHGTVIDLVPAYEAWADRCFAAGSPTLLASLAAAAAGRESRMGVARLGRRPGRRSRPAAPSPRRAWLQVALPHPAGCSLGVCLGCVTPGTSGPVRACREGPVFAADALRWETMP